MSSRMAEAQFIEAEGCFDCDRQKPHHGCLLALQNESFIVARVPALPWPGETNKAKLNLDIWDYSYCFSKD